MDTQNLNIEQVMQDRRKAVEESIQRVSLEDLRALVTTLFPVESHPWNQDFRAFLDESAGDTFYKATTNDQIHIVYCSTKERGLWYIPEKGVGIMQAKGLQILKEVVAAIPR